MRNIIKGKNIISQSCIHKLLVNVLKSQKETCKDTVNKAVPTWIKCCMTLGSNPTSENILECPAVGRKWLQRTVGQFWQQNTCWQRLEEAKWGKRTYITSHSRFVHTFCFSGFYLFLNIEHWYWRRPNYERTESVKPRLCLIFSIL